MSHAETEGPIPLGAANDLVWFARGRVVVGVPRTADGGVDETIRKLTERYEQVGQKLALAIIIKEDTERPGLGMDKKIRRALDDAAPMVACSAIAILGSGFFASFFISLLSRAFRLSAHRAAQRRIHTDLEAAAEWMHKHLNDPGTSAADILQTLRWAEAEGR